MIRGPQSGTSRMAIRVGPVDGLCGHDVGDICALETSAQTLDWNCSHHWLMVVRRSSSPNRPRLLGGSCPRYSMHRPMSPSTKSACSSPPTPSSADTLRTNPGGLAEAANERPDSGTLRPRAQTKSQTNRGSSNKCVTKVAITSTSASDGTRKAV